MHLTTLMRLEDEREGMTSTRRTGKVLVDSINEILNFLKFTLEIGDDFQDGKLPSLDTTVWVEWKTCQEGILKDEVSPSQEQNQHQDDHTGQMKNSEELSSQTEGEEVGVKDGYPGIMFEYFEKPMSSNLVVQARSARQQGIQPGRRVC